MIGRDWKDAQSHANAPVQFVSDECAHCSCTYVYWSVKANYGNSRHILEFYFSDDAYFWHMRICCKYRGHWLHSVETKSCYWQIAYRKMPFSTVTGVAGVNTSLHILRSFDYSLQSLLPIFSISHFTCWYHLSFGRPLPFFPPTPSCKTLYISLLWGILMICSNHLLCML